MTLDTIKMVEAALLLHEKNTREKVTVCPHTCRVEPVMRAGRLYRIKIWVPDGD